MMTTEYKFGEVHKLATQIENGPERVVFKHIFENANGGVSLLAFKAGQNLAQHLAPAEVMIYVLEGEVEFTMIDRPPYTEIRRFHAYGRRCAPQCCSPIRLKINTYQNQTLIRYGKPT